MAHLLVTAVTVVAGPSPDASAANLSFTDINPDGPSPPRNSAAGGRVNGLDVASGNNQVIYAASEWGGVFKSTNQGDTWSRLDDHLPVVGWDVAVDPTNNSRVIATSFFDGRADSDSGIQVSTNAGTIWSHPASATPTVGDNCASTARRIEPSAFGIGIHPTTGDMYVGTNCGLARSTDGGATWNFVDPTPGDAADDVWDVVVQDDGSADGIVDVCGDDGVLRSTDGGDNWTNINGDLPLSVAFGRCSIAASPDETYVLFVNFGTRFFEADDANQDATTNWTEFNNVGGTGNARIPFVETNPRSGNGGRDFNLWASGGVTLFRDDCTTPSPASPGGGLRCTQDASTWTNAQSGAHDDSGDVVFDPSVASDGCPLVYSSDGGVHTNTNTSSPGCHDPSWQESNEGQHSLWLYTMDTADQSGLDSEDLYMGAQDNGSYASTDAGTGGATWSFPDCCDVFNATASSTEVVWDVCCGYGLFYGNPGMTGQTAVANTPPGCCTQGFATFTFPDYIDRYGSDNYVAVTNQGAFTTTDITASPVNWTQLGANPAGGWCGVQAAENGGTVTFYAQTTCIGVFEGQGSAQLWKYEGTDPGGSWTRVDNNDGITGGIGIFAVDPTDPDRLYASNLSGAAGARMIVSDDGGDTWDFDPDLDFMMTGDPLQTGDVVFPMQNTRGATSFTGFRGYEQPTLVAFDPEDPNIVIAGGRDSGVFMSQNGGDDWALLTDPFEGSTGSAGRPHLPRPFFANFDHEPSNPSVFIGTQGRGAWRLSLPNADLSVSKSDDPDPVVAGEDLTYTVTVTNAGPDSAPNATMVDDLPAETTFQALSSPAGWDCETPSMGDPNGEVRCIHPDFGVGAATFTITVTVDPSTADGSSITNDARTFAAAVDATLADNEVSESTTVNAEADLSVTKADDPDPVVAGEGITYTVDVSNAGPSDAVNVEVTDTLPAEVSSDSASGTGWSCSEASGVVTCTRASLAAGDSAPTITITGTVDPATADGATITNDVEVSSDTDDPDTSDNDDSEDTDVIREADIEVGKTESEDPAPRGGEFTYTVTATNNGPSNAEDVTITDDLPPEVEFVSAAPSAGGACPTTPAPGDLNGTVTCSWAGDTAPGDTRTVVITVRVHPPVTEGTVMSDTATASSDETDTDTSNNEVTITTTVGAPDCTITGSRSIYGTDGDDVICGSDGRDRIYAGDGDDLIFAYGSYDRVYGQGGNDEIVGDDGSDLLYGGTGDDEIWGLGGNDRLYGQSGFDELDGGADADRCYTQTDGGTTTNCEAGS